eukprot:15749113-Heterocapsa_arctica.AAC.1
MVCAHMLQSMEASEHVTSELINDVRYTGLKGFVFKSDGEPAIKAVKDNITTSLDQEYQVIHEESPVGDHQANGDIENAIREIEKEIRRLKGAAESHLGRAIDSQRPIL